MTEVTISWGALVRLGAAILVGWALVKVAPELLLVVVSVLIAITLHPLVERLGARGVSRGAAVVGLAVLALAMIFTAALFVLPSLSDQVTSFLGNVPELKKRTQSELGSHPVLGKIVGEVLSLPTSPEVKKWLARPLSWGSVAVEAAAGLVLGFVFTFYLVYEGRLLTAWLLAYVPRRHRRRMAATLPEVQEVIATFVRTQALLSTLFAGFCFGVLTLLKVPAAVPLAVLAALCDAIPVLGIMVAVAVSSVVALSVSPATALKVIGFYAAYHVLEFYVLLPRLYGSRLRISPLAVLLALFVGGALGGILGAVLILPFVAAYPVVERHWLSEYLSDEVVNDHQALEGAEKSEEKHEVAGQVLRGEKTEPSPGG